MQSHNAYEFTIAHFRCAEVKCRSWKVRCEEAAAATDGPREQECTCDEFPRLEAGLTDEREAGDIEVYFHAW